MSGSKSKNKAPASPALPAALQGPPINAAPAPQPLPGQLEAISQQINQGYPSMPQAEMLSRLQSIYTPPPPLPAPALASPTAAPMARATSARTSTPYRGGMINTPGELISMIMSARQGR